MGKGSECACAYMNRQVCNSQLCCLFKSKRREKLEIYMIAVHHMTYVADKLWLKVLLANLLQRKILFTS